MIAFLYQRSLITRPFLRCSLQAIGCNFRLRAKVPGWLRSKVPGWLRAKVPGWLRGTRGGEANVAAQRQRRSASACHRRRSWHHQHRPTWEGVLTSVDGPSRSTTLGPAETLIKKVINITSRSLTKKH